MDKTSKEPPGIAVDSGGSAAVDPTANVIALTEAANKRQDDLRELNNRLLDAEVRRVEQMAILRYEHNRTIGELRALHATEINAMESQRVNAIRNVDVLASTRNETRTETAMQTVATALATTVTGIHERLSALERSSYEGKGKSTVADPQMEKLATLVEKLAVAQTLGNGKTEGVNWVAAVVMGSVSVIAGLLAIAGVLYGVLKH